MIDWLGQGPIQEVSNEREKQEMSRIGARDNLVPKSKEGPQALALLVMVVTLDQGLTVVLQTIVQ